MKIEEAIVQLLLRHNCVIVPAFGGFVAHSSSAVIDLRTGVMSPPRKSVLFNKQLVNNDGLLINYLSRAAKIEYDAAQQIVIQSVIDWQTRLKEGQRVSIDKIGHLYLDAERNISFEQDRFFNLLLQSYGLNKVHFITEEEVKITAYQNRPEKVVTVSTFLPQERKEFKAKDIPVAIEVEEETKIISLSEDTSNRKWMKYVAAAILLPFAFYTYWIPVKTNVIESGMISFNDFNPSYQAGKGIYQQKPLSFEISIAEKTAPVLSENGGNFKSDEDKKVKRSAQQNQETKKIEPQDLDKKTPISAEAVKIPIPQKETSVQSASPQLIVGCFSSAENAKSMVATLKSEGFNARIVDVKGGLTRVSAGGSNSPSEMQIIEKKAGEKGYKGWVLR